MTETHWRVCAEPHAMLEFFRDRGRDRKLRLYAVACCRRVWNQIGDERSKVAIETSERFADGVATESELTTAFTAHERTFGRHAHDGVYYAIEEATRPGFDPYYVLSASSHKLISKEREGQCDLLREIFGNPFRPVTFNPEWRTDTAVALARQMYASRDFSGMPILADALQDAGCDSDDILAHCRDANATHVRGCWVVDLVLNKS